jgi:citrate lyase subunit beta/citryl-CoA lyase
MQARSFLFVPADRPERFLKALASGADRIIVDLEDAVALEQKDAARATLEKWLAAPPDGARVLVRINGSETGWHGDDLRLANLPGVAGLVVPKAEDPAALATVRAALDSSRELLALVETIKGFVNLRQVAAVQGLARLAFGSVDFCSEAGIGAEDRELDYVRSQLVIESRYAGLAAPVDGVTLALDDAQVLEADTRRARSFGFGGKMCIHPKQVGAVNEGFVPSAVEREWAARVLAALRDNPHGAVAVDGKLVDKPVIDRARLILAYE